MGIQIQQTAYKAVPTGGYPAVIEGLEDQDGLYGPQIRWTFRIEQPGTEWDGATMTGWTSAKFSPKSTLYAWTRAAFGRDIPSDYKWDSDHLLGKRVQLVVVEKVKPDGSEFSKVEAVRSLKQAGQTQPVAAAAEQEQMPF